MEIRHFMMVVPAILPKSKKEFVEKIKLVAPYVDKVQFDIMDGIFVPNKTWSTPAKMVETYEKIKANLNPNLGYEVHLMVNNPENLIKFFVINQAETIFFHYEAMRCLTSFKKAYKEERAPYFVLDLIERYNKLCKKRKSKKGIAINPETPVEKIIPYFDKLDVILVMGVNPGFSGQRFQKRVLKKIRQIKEIKPKLKIGVDGGVNLKNAKEIVSAGADYLVSASAIFKSKNIKEIIKKFNKL